MDTLNLGTELLQKRFALKIERSQITQAVYILFDIVDEQIDIEGLVGRFMSHHDLHTLIGSWLGHEPNKPLPIEAIAQIFGKKKIDQFAEVLGIEKETACRGLTEIIPDLLETISNSSTLQAENLAMAITFAKNIF